jgi:glyoxylase-like metal-dependent hydrolase (beta-lactamase superfamily II)
LKVTSLKSDESIYTCNAYLVLGTWKAIKDINTLVDIGTDGSIIDEIEGINTGVGKKPVEQIIFTHGHFDHVGGLKQLKDKYNPRVYAYSHFEGVDELLKDGQVIKMGDREFEVVHVPGHSSDSICLYCEQEGILFSGDTPVRVMTIGGSYSPGFIKGLERLSRRPVGTIYSGHDKPMRRKVQEMIRETLQNVRESGMLNCL